MISDKAKEGNRRATLEELRNHLAQALEEAEPKAKAPLAAQLRATMAELDALPTTDGRSILDELEDRRKRRSGTSGADKTSGGKRGAGSRRD